MKKVYWLVLIFMSISGSVCAEGRCPPGSYPIGGGGVGGCAPIPGYEDSRETQAPAATGRWTSTWGAISISEATGDVGVVIGMRSEQDADSEAVRRCAIYGAIDCDADFAYSNQCGVIAWATENGQSAGGASVIDGGISIEDASRKAIASCEKMRNGRSCRIIYGECTSPVFESF